MTGARPPEAAAQYCETFQLALSSVTNSVVTIRGGYHPSERPHVLLLADGFPVPLMGEPPLRLTVLQQYRIIENAASTTREDTWRVTTTAYMYQLDRADGQELLAYHWHPNVESPIVTPHLHIGSGSQATSPGLTEAHLPTGRVSLEAVLRTVITEFGVEPTRGDWESVLSHTEARYSNLRSW